VTAREINGGGIRRISPSAPEAGEGFSSFFERKGPKMPSTGLEGERSTDHGQASNPCGREKGAQTKPLEAAGVIV
jgi:hypothetical protein